MASVKDDDLEYRIAYDVDRCKVGCVLIQVALGGDVPHDLFYNHFPAEGWTVAVSGCQVYPIRRCLRHAPRWTKGTDQWVAS